MTKGGVAEKTEETLSFEKRLEEVRKYLREKGFEAEVQPIYDKYGPSVEGDFDVIVVSPETFKVAGEVNDLRVKGNLLKSYVIPFVVAEDGLPITSSRREKGG